MNTSSDSSSAYEVARGSPIALEAHEEQAEPDLQPCVLLVEDSPTTLRLLSKPLSERYELLVARDGLDAWELIQSHPEIELVITDIMMPRLSGHELLVKIRESESLQIRNLPVIVIAGVVDKDDRDLAFRNGANDFVTKPIDSAELQARVRVHHKLSRTIRELEASRQALAEQATTDPLTRLKNRRAFYQEGRHGLALSQRSNTSLSVMLLDLDHFKRVNDTYGHQAGDKVLIAISALLGRMSRAVDTVARVGGEEFAIVLPGTNRDGAAVLAERIRAAVEKAPFQAHGEPLSITISIGFATFSADSADTVEGLLKIADRRLYTAKREGRNRVCANDNAANKNSS
ncbi:MAG: GGDEF domain-containing protein [Acidiferrobacterales bacterium]